MPNLSQLLTTKSSVEYKRVFEHCRDISNELDGVDGVYIVGGIVRDLILDRAPGDIDLSVVGDAKAFSQELAARIGAASPDESQFLTFKIRTSGIFSDVSSIDVVTARAESYADSAALPDVSVSSIDDDLKRRDFTVNAMAISLAGSDWGTLVDPNNGFGDVMRKRIKVLHDSSFVDDPTRIFRAVRYAVRLGFKLDSRMNELISKSIANIDRLSGTRVRNEFELVLSEPNRVEMLRMSEEIGLLAAISPGLRIGTKALQVLSEQSESDSVELPDLLAITTFGLNEDEANQVVQRFDAPPASGESITGNAQLAKHVAVLDQPNLAPSEVAEILREIPLASINAYILAGPPLPRRDKLVEYVEKIRFIKPEITGDDLLEIGIPQGPIIGQLIDVVRRAKLDGKVSTKQDEIELAKSRLPGFLAK
ncbi:MAG: CCA tRNA nucleotidyltransferase [Chloroflexi bacterium]|nr:CCA tRNA nucleotidyltransferase [Chloroflexota bacterium]MBT4943934.1 CCA tRNA nucleotidyltransferase [Chloroflexota bacterium]MBT5476155.1 CCA tRNA nucleotidyltransferase [Chloroflexota bacterium]